MKRKISASRAKCQIYWSISEAQPNFCGCEADTKVSANERNAKFIGAFAFPFRPASFVSVTAKQ